MSWALIVTTLLAALAFALAIPPKVKWGVRLVLFIASFILFNVALVLLWPTSSLWVRLLLGTIVLIIMAVVSLRAGGDENKNLAVTLIVLAVLGAVGGLLILGSEMDGEMIANVKTIFGWVPGAFVWMASLIS